MNELKNCPFHNCLTCGCYDCVDIPDKQWNTRPIEDALQARIAELETAINTVIEMSYIDVDHYAKRLDSNRAFSSCFTGIREVLSKVNNE